MKFFSKIYKICSKIKRNRVKVKSLEIKGRRGKIDFEKEFTLIKKNNIDIFPREELKTLDIENQQNAIMYLNSGIKPNFGYYNQESGSLNLIFDLVTISLATLSPSAPTLNQEKSLQDMNFKLLRSTDNQGVLLIVYDYIKTYYIKCQSCAIFRHVI